MGKKIWSFLSYVLVALAASMTTLLLVSAMWTGDAGASKLDELEKLILERFIGEADATAMEDAAADAMVSSLGDRWSYYIPSSEYDSYKEQTENAYVGIGVTIQLTEEGILVTKVTGGGPAEQAGILAGDYIVRVNSLDATGQSLDAVRNEVRGEAGTYVELSVSRGGEEYSFRVERREILVEVATCEMLDDTIGLIRIDNFDQRCAEATLDCIEKLRSCGAQALIFDVRNNPGGYKNEMVQILDYLLPEGPLFRSVDYRGIENVDESDGDYLDMPMAVIVNGESYSAAEFFAAALREYDAAFVVGTQTCGKGYFQNTFQLPDGSAVGLSVGKYFTPKGVSLAEVGITPDYEVTVDEQMDLAIYAGTVPAMEDPQILKAYETIKK